MNALKRLARCWRAGKNPPQIIPMPVAHPFPEVRMRVDDVVGLYVRLVTPGREPVRELEDLADAAEQLKKQTWIEINALHNPGEAF